MVTEGTQTDGITAIWMVVTDGITAVTNTYHNGSHNSQTVGTNTRQDGSYRRHKIEGFIRGCLHLRPFSASSGAAENYTVPTVLAIYLETAQCTVHTAQVGTRDSGAATYLGEVPSVTS